MSRMTCALLVGFLLAGFVGLQALTISPELVQKLKSEGAWEAFAREFQQWQQRIEGSAMPFKLMPDKMALGTDGVRTMRIVVLLVDFSDNPSTGGAVGNLDTTFFDTLLFKENPTQPRSMTDFYLENSYGNFRLTGDVYGWFRMPLTYAQYVGSNNGLQGVEPNARTMAHDAVAAADPTVNFSLYDNDLDGYVDAVFVIHAGIGAEETPGHAIWSHQWTLSQYYQTNDNARVRNYLTGPEEEYVVPSKIGVFCHEFGHILGLPDLYDVATDSASSGVGSWSLMGSGSWNGGGRIPARFDAWCMNYLDSVYGVFGKTITVTSNLTNVVIGSAVHDSVRYRLIMPGNNGREYFLIDNRQQEGFDRGLSGSGLMILHCDDNLSGSNNSSNGHLHVAVEQADGLDQLGHGIGEGDDKDLFPGPYGLYTEFTNLTNPSTLSYTSLPNELSVWDIRSDAVQRTITCNLDKTYSRANIQMLQNSLSDARYGNNNQILDKGERVEFFYTIENYWKVAYAVTVRLSSPTPGITFGVSKDSFGVIGTEQQKDNSARPFDFTISPSISPINARFDLKVISGSPADTFLTTIYKYVGGVEILLVDSDDDSAAIGLLDRRSFYTSTLDSLRLPYNVWDASRNGPPGSAQYGYRTIIWFTGDHRPDVISPAEVTFLRNYLDGGGHLFLTGQNIAKQLSTTSDSTFTRDYLGVRYASSYEPLDVYGGVGDPVGNGDSLRIRGSDGASNQFSCDVLRVLPQANRSYTYKFNGGYAGSLYARTGGVRVAFWGFGFESVSNKLSGYSKRRDVLQRVLAFFDDNTSTDVSDGYVDAPLPALYELSQNYPNPFNPSTIISYVISPKLAGKPISLDIYNILGEKVTTLVSGAARSGSYTAEFDAGDRPSGVYFYRLSIGDESVTRKMVLTK